MSRHSEIERRLVKFLIEERGFDRKVLLFDPTYTNTEGVKNVRPDVVGIEPNSKEPIVIFEIKTSLPTDRQAKYLAQVLSYVAIDEQGAIPVYLVITNDSDSLEFYKVNDDKEFEIVDVSDVPTFGDFIRAKLAPKLPELKKESDKTKDNFKVICITLSIISILLVILDIVLMRVLEFELLTTSRMALIGASIALILIPYAQKFKGLGIEYERIQKETQKD